MPTNRINYARQKSFNLTVRGRRAVNRNKTSYPFLSGDAFANSCDLVVFGKKEIFKGQLERARSVFCPSEKLEEFLAAYGDTISAEILVFGNTDRDFYELTCDFPSSVKSVYLQNSHISNDFFQTLPIGIENLRYGRNGQLSLFKESFAEQEKSEKILVGPFSPTHHERYELNSWKSIRHPRLQVISDHLRPKTLATLASTFKFIACPRGNGTDTHRFWETLYRGSIPVVKRSKWSESIAEIGIPMVQLNSWDFEEFIEQADDKILMRFQPERISLLWMEHWERTFHSDLK